MVQGGELFEKLTASELTALKNGASDKQRLAKKLIRDASTEVLQNCQVTVSIPWLLPLPGEQRLARKLTRNEACIEVLQNCVCTVGIAASKQEQGVYSSRQASAQLMQSGH